MSKAHTRPVVPRCFLCSSPAAATIFAPHGCACSDQQTQARCVQHMMRLRETDDNYDVVETYPMYEMLVSLPPAQQATIDAA